MMTESLYKFKAEIFQALAHPTRIAIVELLRQGELSAGQILSRLQIEPANASQHLAVLRSRQIVTSRKDGNQVFYAVRDPLLFEVLDILRRYFEAHLEEALNVLSELRTETPVRPQRVAAPADSVKAYPHPPGEETCGGS